MAVLDWSKLYNHRKKIADRFGTLWKLPLKKRYFSVLAPLGGSNSRLLEIGAGERGLKSKLANVWGKYDYKSCDIDQTHPHDFSHISEVTGEFDVICLFEIIEHLNLDQAAEMLHECYAFAQQGSKIVVTTPNVYYPPAYLRDVTHCTAWSYDELGGFLELAGFQVVSIHRLYHDSLFKRFLRQYIFYPWFRVMNFDFARQIIVVAEK